MNSIDIIEKFTGSFKKKRIKMKNKVIYEKKILSK